MGERSAIGGGDGLGGITTRLPNVHFQHMVALALGTVRVRWHDKSLKATDAFVQHSLAHTHPP